MPDGAPEATTIVVVLVIVELTNVVLGVLVVLMVAVCVTVATVVKTVDATVVDGLVVTTVVEVVVVVDWVATDASVTGVASELHAELKSVEEYVASGDGVLKLELVEEAWRALMARLATLVVSVATIL